MKRNLKIISRDNASAGVHVSPGDAVLLVSRDAEVAWPLASRQDELCSRVKRLLSSFVCCLQGKKSKLPMQWLVYSVLC